MKIRRAKVGDVDLLLPLLSQLAAGRTPKHVQSPEFALRLLVSDSASCILVAETGGQLIGSCQLVTFISAGWQVAPAALLENVVVDKGHRRNGVGRALVHRAVNVANDIGCYKVMLQTGSRQSWKLEFYRSCGFTEDGRKAFILSL